MTSPAISQENSTPIFSFANGELGPVSSALIRGVEKSRASPKSRNFILITSMMTAPTACFGKTRLNA